MRVEELLKQMKREFIKVKLIQSLLDGLVFFLITNMVLFLLSINIFSNIPNHIVLAALTVFFTVSNLVYRVKKYSLEIYEEENPELQEILRTARDNIDKQNIVSQALFDDLLERSRKVTSESIIPAKKIVYKTLLVGFLSFLTVISGIGDIQLLQDSTDLLDAPDQIEDLINPNSTEDGFQLKNASGIYGESSDIDSSDLDIDFNVSGTGDSEEGEFDPTQDPTSDDLVLDSTGESMNEDLELAKQYSLAVKDIG
jgi:hypothetical protein